MLTKPDVPLSEPVTARNLDLKELAGGKEAKAPWHFKVLIAAVVIYLAWRVVQLVIWAVT